MSTLHIHEYAELYKQEVISLILNIQQKEFNIPITIEEQPDLMDIPEFYQIEKGNFWVATFEGAVVGTIALLDIGHSQGGLRKMFVDEKYRGKTYAVGQALLDTLFIWTEEMKYKEIFLGTTRKFIAAQKFYVKNGFTEIEKASLPSQFPIMPVDVKFYKYEVPV